MTVTSKTPKLTKSLLQKTVKELFNAHVKQHFNQKKLCTNSTISYYEFAYKSYVDTPELPSTILYPKGLDREQLHAIYILERNTNVAYKQRKHAETINQAITASASRIILSKVPKNILNQLRNNASLSLELSNLIKQEVDKLIGTPDQILNYLNAEYEKHSDIELIKKLKKIKPHLTNKNLLTAALSRDVIMEMIDNKANKMPIYAFINQSITSLLPNTRTDEQKVKHPGQLITGIKNHYGITQENWKVFISMTPSILYETPDLIHILISIGRKKPSPAIRRFLQYTNVANNIRNIRNSTAQHMSHIEQPDSKTQERCEVSCEETIERNNNSLRALYAIFNVIYDRKYVTTNEFYNECRDISDYLQDYYRNNQTYPFHSTWNNLMRAVNSWHFEIQRRNALRQMGNKQMDWNTLLLEQEIDDYKVTPLVSNISLIAEGRTMHHCVGGYWREAMDKHYRLFHIEHKDNYKDAGTLCIQPVAENDGLITNQLRSYSNANVSPALQKIANRVLIRYRNIYRKTDPELRTWNRTTDLTTGDILDTQGFPERDITLDQEYEIEIEPEEELIVA